MAVLDGGVAVRCNPKPALAGLKSRSRSSVDRPAASSAALKVWSCAATTFEPCQVRKEAAVRSVRRVPQGCRARAKRAGGLGGAPIDNGCTANPLLVPGRDSAPWGCARASGCRSRFSRTRGVAAAIVRAARLTPTTDVLEVGPGLGVMTGGWRRRRDASWRSRSTRLCRGAADRSCLTKRDRRDRRRPEARPDHVFRRAVRRRGQPAVPHHLARAAPLAGQSGRRSPQRLVVMVQAEVAERIAAQPGADERAGGGDSRRRPA